MKTRILKQTSVIALMAIAALTMTFSIVSGQNAEENQSSSSSNAPERTIEGVWRTQITPRDCQTGAPLLTFPGLITYHKGGTMSETAGSPSGPPSPRSPGHGVWNRRNRRHYEASFVLQLFNLDGTFAGTQKITQNLRLNASGDRWDDNTTLPNFQIFDANDHVIATGCATAVGTRFE